MNAQKRLIQAMAQCLEHKPIDQITVADLIEAADVSKPTFYRLYNDKFELLKDFYQTVIIDELYTDDPSIEEIYRSTYETFAFFREHKTLTRNMFFSKDDFALKEFFRRTCVEGNRRMWEALGADMEDEVMQSVLKIYSYGNASMIMDWLKTDMSGDLAKMTDVYFMGVPIGVFTHDAERVKAELAEVLEARRSAVSADGAAD